MKPGYYEEGSLLHKRLRDTSKKYFTYRKIFNIIIVSIVLILCTASPDGRICWYCRSELSKIHYTTEKDVGDMVSPLSLLCMSITLLVTFLFPLGLLIYLHRKERISWKAVLVGAVVFTVFQFLTRLPLLTFLNSQPLFQALNPWVLAIVVAGLSAGLFEESGRYLGFRYFLKNELSWKNGIAFGLGHGGIEAVGLTGLTYINNIVISIMINTGLFESMIAPQLGAEAEWIKGQLTGLPPEIFLAAGLERILAMTAHIAFSLVVLYGVMNRKMIFLVYAILLHTLLNAPAVLLPYYGYNFWIVELYLLLFALAAAVFIVKSRPWFNHTEVTLK